MLKARETYILEEKRTREEIQKESQTRSSLLQVKHYLTTLKDDIKRVKEEKENQKEVIIEVEKRIDELNRDMVKLQIKVEKFTSIIEE